ncbi:MAG TPA: CpsD/CapB family tyrosine-protein kinase [Pirellulaceae bacterium]|nr:CpsD/CapB family tyrosine-protein kinase [Pirellulaceae bacterium]
MSTAAPKIPLPDAPPSQALGGPTQQPLPSEIFSQAQALAQRIQALLPQEQARGRVVGVTSCARQEGVSVVAGNLAVCASEMYTGSVLLIDANPRHASVASHFGVEQARGLGDCLAGECTAQECLVGTAHPNLCVLPAGSTTPRSFRFPNEHATAMFENLRRYFDLIVLDLPPFNEIDELFHASQRADGILLVLEAERIHRQAAQRMKRQLEQVNAKLLGVVLNKRNNHVPEWLYRRL